MSTREYEALVTDYAYRTSPNSTEVNPEAEFQFDNGYTVTLIRTPDYNDPQVDMTTQLREEYRSVAWEPGKFEIVAWTRNEDPMAILFGVDLQPAVLPDLLPDLGNSAKGSLTNADVNELLTTVSQLPAVTA